MRPFATLLLQRLIRQQWCFVSGNVEDTLEFVSCFLHRVGAREYVFALVYIDEPQQQCSDD